MGAGSREESTKVTLGSVSEEESFLERFTRVGVRDSFTFLLEQCFLSHNFQKLFCLWCCAIAYTEVTKAVMIYLYTFTNS